LKKSKKAEKKLKMRILQYEKAISLRSKNPAAYTKPGSCKRKT
jgi:hypothetical protein